MKIELITLNDVFIVAKEACCKILLVIVSGEEFPKKYLSTLKLRIHSFLTKALVDISCDKTSSFISTRNFRLQRLEMNEVNTKLLIIDKGLCFSEIRGAKEAAIADETFLFLW